MLNLLLIPPPAGQKDAPPTPAVQFFDQLEIYPGTPVLVLSSHHPRIQPSRMTGSKIKHFKELHKKTGLPYSEMVRLVLPNSL